MPRHTACPCCEDHTDHWEAIHLAEIVFLFSQEENGGAGVYSADLRKHYMLDNPSWKRDIMPEIIEGKNILDYVDPEIEAKLEALEMEEEALAAAAAIEVILTTV